MSRICNRKGSPQNNDRRLMTIMMIRGHSSAAKWGLSHISTDKSYKTLDVGCGDGANLVRLHSLCPEGMVVGIDSSEICVKKSQKAISAAINSKACSVIQADVTALPFEEDCFDLVTAFETIYSWLDPEQAFRQIIRVLKPGGWILICNEADGPNDRNEHGMKKMPTATIYNAGQLKCFLCNAGFSDVLISHEAEKHWFCMTAKKPNVEVAQ